jgi:hypothetical protein
MAIKLDLLEDDQYLKISPMLQTFSTAVTKETLKQW